MPIPDTPQSPQSPLEGRLDHRDVAAWERFVAPYEPPAFRLRESHEPGDQRWSTRAGQVAA